MYNARDRYLIIKGPMIRLGEEAEEKAEEEEEEEEEGNEQRIGVPMWGMSALGQTRAMSFIVCGQSHVLEEGIWCA